MRSTGLLSARRQRFCAIAFAGCITFWSVVLHLKRDCASAHIALFGYQAYIHIHMLSEPHRTSPDRTRTRGMCRIKSGATALLNVVGNNRTNQTAIDETDASRELSIAFRHAT